MLESSRFFFPVFLNVQLTKATAIPPLPALQWNVDAEGGVIHQRDAASLPKNERAFALVFYVEGTGTLRGAMHEAANGMSSDNQRQ